MCEIFAGGGAGGVLGGSQRGERCRKRTAEGLASLFWGQEILHSLALFYLIFNLILFHFARLLAAAKVWSRGAGSLSLRGGAPGSRPPSSARPRP